jgi:hypothetical protein
LPTSGGGTYGLCKPLIDAGFPPGSTPDFIGAHLRDLSFSAGRALAISDAIGLAIDFADARCNRCF